MIIIQSIIFWYLVDCTYYQFKLLIYILEKTGKINYFIPKTLDNFQQINDKIYQFQGQQEELLDLYDQHFIFTSFIIQIVQKKDQLLCYEQLVILQEQISRISPQKKIDLLLSLSYTLQQLIQKYDDVKIKYNLIKILDKMIKICKMIKIHDNFDTSSFTPMPNNLFQFKARIYQQIAKQTQNLNEKQKIFDLMLQSSEEACQLQPDNQKVAREKMDYLLSVFLQLDFSNIMNQYYDKAIEKIFKIIYKRLISEEQNLFIEKFINAFNAIFAVNPNKKVATLFKGDLIGNVFEQLGDLLEGNQKHYYYNTSLETYETILDVKSNAVLEDCFNSFLVQLLLKINEKLKAISLMKKTKLFEAKSEIERIFPVWFSPCSKLENSNLREALIIYRITNTHISLESHKRQIVYDL